MNSSPATHFHSIPAALLLAGGAVVLQGDAALLAHAPASGQSLAISTGLEFAAECTESQLLADGEDVPPQERPPGFELEDLTLDVELEMDFTESAFDYLEGELVRFVRELGSLRMGGLPVPLPGSIGEGSMVAFTRDNAREDWSRMLVDDLDASDGEELAELALLHPDLALGGLAPDGEVEVGDAWSVEVDAPLFARLMLPGFDLDGVPELADGLGLEGFTAELVRGLPERFADGMGDAELELSVDEIESDDDGSVASISVSGMVTADVSLTEAFNQLAEDLEADAGVVVTSANFEIEFAVDGELTWRVEPSRHLETLELEFIGPASVTGAGEVEDTGESMGLEFSLAWDVEHRISLDLQ